MRYWTWGEVRDKVIREHDLQEEPDFLSPGELASYLNDAIDNCEQVFIRLGDYFLTSKTIDVVAEQAEYDLPDDIYGTKIRRLIKNDKVIKREKNLSRINLGEKGDPCRYILINRKGETPKIRLVPIPSNSFKMDIFYTRNANRIDPNGDDNQVIDMPEANLYIHTYLKRAVFKKEKLLTLADAENALLERQLVDLENALSAQTDDDDNFIEPDYGDMEAYYAE